jgi:hypothetical protein
VSRHLPSTLFFEEVYAQPAATPWQPYTGAGSVEASYACNRQEDYHLLREGEGGQLLALSTKGKARYAQALLWGGAAYGYRQQSRTQWSNVSDYLRITPYQLADSIGGTLYGETYRLSGGLALTTGAWRWAGELAYRAENGYRRNDPRPRTIVSDLTAKLGGSAPLGRYQVGVTINGVSYQQDVDVNVFAPNTKAHIYAMRGFGLSDLLNSGYTASFHWQYSGASGGASAFLLPRNREGWMAHAAVGQENMESVWDPSTPNNCYPYLLRTMSANALAGYKMRSNAAASELKLAWASRQSTGSERLYKLMKPEGATLSEYHLLSESDKYYRTTMQLTLSGLHEQYGARHSRWLQVDAGLSVYSEEYVLPAYVARYVHATLQATVGAERTWSKLLLAAEVALGYRQLAAKEEALPRGSYTFDRSMKPDLEVIASSPLNGGVKVTCEHDFIGRTRWYVSAQAAGAYCRKSHALWGTAAAGVTF